ncbi:cold-regulated protein 27 isoform X2 [Euphorbia lathyris]|uniref:cold-regulated protein 27 isoform X2 n=1 Tax=Euphorbia lathyris TaxID=212925 RepID=UPI0033132978
MDGFRSKAHAISQPSVSSSADSAHFAQQDLTMEESMCTEWTNEKHSLYLKSMEASFVNQLYDSMDLLGLQMPKEMSDRNISQQGQYNTSTSSGQFKVLRGGSWKRVNFQKPDSQVNVKNEPHEILTNPWIQHFKPARKSQVTPLESDASLCQATNLSEKTSASGGRATFSKHSYPSYHDDLVDCNTEVSDQNFVDEDIKTEKKRSICSSKRLKIRKNAGTSNEQVSCSSGCN